MCNSLQSRGQAPLSTEFPSKEYWSGLPFPTSRDFPDPGVEPKSLASPALAGSSKSHQFIKFQPLSSCFLNILFDGMGCINKAFLSKHNGTSRKISDSFFGLGAGPAIFSHETPFFRERMTDICAVVIQTWVVHN